VKAFRKTVDSSNRTADIEAVRQLLRNRRGRTTRSAKNHARIKADAATHLITQLAGIIKAGIPLVSAFDLLIKGAGRKPLKQLLEVIRQDLVEGHSLSQALSNRSREFDPLLCNLVAVGEQTGRLDEMLIKIARYREGSASLKKQVWSALTYPSIVMITALVVTGLMLVNIIPRFETLFSNFGAELPAFTQAVVMLSEVAQAWWLETLLILGLGTAGFHSAYKRIRPFKLKIDSLVLRLPLFGGLIRKSILTRYIHTLVISFEAGNSLIASLETLANDSGNSFYDRAIQQVIDKLIDGQSLHLAMRSAQAFPPMLLQSVALGEETGALSDMLSKIAEYYEAEVATKTKRLVSLLEPLTMCILAVLTGALIIAVYLPVFSLGGVFGGHF